MRHALRGREGKPHQAVLSLQVVGNSRDRVHPCISCTEDAIGVQLAAQVVRRTRSAYNSWRKLYGGRDRRTTRGASCTEDATTVQLVTQVVRRTRPPYNSWRKLYGGRDRRAARGASCPSTILLFLDFSGIPGSPDSRSKKPFLR